MHLAGPQTMKAFESTYCLFVCLFVMQIKNVSSTVGARLTGASRTRTVRSHFVKILKSSQTVCSRLKTAQNIARPTSVATPVSRRHTK